MSVAALGSLGIPKPGAVALAIAVRYGPVLPLCWPAPDGTCGCGEGHRPRDVGKAPIGRLVPRGCKDASADPEIIRRWWAACPDANVGLDLERAGLLLVDPDSPDARREVMRLGAPPTLIRQSRNPAYLYQRTADCPVTSAIRTGDSGALDLKTKGYAVVYGTHRTGCDVFLEDFEPEDPPGWAVERLREVARRRERDATAVTDPSDEPPVRLDGQGLARWRGELVERTPEGHVDRSRSLFRLGLALAEGGGTARTVREELGRRDRALGWAKYAERSDGDARFAEIAAKAVAHAVRRPERDIHSAVPKDGVAAGSILPFVTAREIAETAPSEPDWLAEPYVARGAVTELDGKAKSAGKTTLVTHLVKAVTEGLAFLGRPTRPTGVVYLTEQSPATFHEALRRAGLLGSEEVAVLFARDTIGIPWPAVVAAAVAEAHRRGAGLLVVDTLPQFAGLKGDGENNAGDALEAVRPLQQAAAVHDLAVLVARHERKSGGEVGDSGRGSSAFAGAVDVVLSLRRAEGNAGPNVRVLHALSRFDGAPDKLVIALEEGGYRALGSEAALAVRLAKLAILEVAPSAQAGARTLDELQEAADIRRTAAQAAVRELVAVGELVKTGAGKKGDPHRYHRPDGSAPSPGDGGQESIHSAGTEPLYAAERNGAHRHREAGARTGVMR
jgi:hypothetical protein